jgi:Domain of unknown function (DUF4214)/Divergent InlB B-repeat domain
MAGTRSYRVAGFAAGFRLYLQEPTEIPMRALLRNLFVLAAFASLAPAAWALSPAIEEAATGSVPSEEAATNAPHPKQLNCGLYMSGNWTFTIDPNTGTAFVTLAAINNDSFGCENPTGTLRLELWAVTSANLPAVRGGGFFGQRIAKLPPAGQLFAGFSFVNNNGNAPYAPPGYGSYWIVLSLSEFSPGCGNADNFCTTDNLVSNAQVTIGNSTLSVGKTGNGVGTVTSNLAGINCGATCTASYFGGNSVTLTATPAPGSVFSGWGGACSGTGTCTVSMNAARSVTATFNVVQPNFRTLNLTRIGSGTVTSSPAGIDCGATCSQGFLSVVTVTLTQTPAVGFVFSGWSGDCTGTGACVLPMNIPRNVTATFALPADMDADGDGIPNGVEVTEGRNPLVKDNDVFSNARLFTMQQYRDFLSREGDASGIQGWVNLINAGTYNRLQVIDAFLSSTEFSGFVAPVVRLYYATFLRIPDYAGLTFNAGLVRNGTVTVLQLADFFTQSPEFASRYGALNNTQFVTLLYNNVLGRAPDTAGLNGWLNQLQSGATRGQVLLGFSDSPEYQASLANEVFVTMMYTGMLRRSPEPTGFAGWVNFLDTAGLTRAQVINGFFLSTEYHNRFLP